MKPSRIQIGKLPVDHITIDDAVSTLVGWAKEKKSRIVFTPNADHVVSAQSNASFAEVYEKVDLSVCDGAPLLWASRFLGKPLPERICGSDLVPALAEQSARHKLSFFLLGAPPGVAELAAKALQAKFENIIIAGTYCPPIGFESIPGANQAVIAAVNAAGPDVLCVGLGSPKQELWLHRHQDALRVGIALGAGATIEFIAGTKARAPQIWRDIGLEWFFRFLQEPRRLGKRYLKDFLFFYIVLKQRLHRSRA